MCKAPDDPADEPERMAKYYRIVGEGNETQGKLVEAFQILSRVRLPAHHPRGRAVAGRSDAKVPINVWLRGRISTMMLNAPDEKRKPLETQIAEEWKLVKAKKDLDAMRTFVDMFDVPVPWDARPGCNWPRRSSRTTIGSVSRGGAELATAAGQRHLQGRRPHGPARLALARLEEKKGTAESMKMAAAYYRDLRRDYPTRPVATGEADRGSALFDDLASDPRYLPYLAEAGPLWSGEKIAAREIASQRRLSGFVFVPEGELSPLMKQCRLMLVLNDGRPKLRLYNFATDTVRWSVDLGSQPADNSAVFSRLPVSAGQIQQPLLPNARFRFYQVRGNLAVIQVATIAYCLDMDTGKSSGSIL